MGTQIALINAHAKVAASSGKADGLVDMAKALTLTPDAQVHLIKATGDLAHPTQRDVYLALANNPNLTEQATEALIEAVNNMASIHDQQAMLDALTHKAMTATGSE